MKSQKRDRNVRAYSRGYQAGLQGRSREACPFGEEETPYQTWLNGWREGREMRGATEFAAIPLLQTG